MITQIDHYYRRRWEHTKYVSELAHIIWKYTWLDNSRCYYKVEDNAGKTFLLATGNCYKDKKRRKSALFFMIYQRVSKLKAKLLW